MISRKKTVVVYGRGYSGNKGDFQVVKKLLEDGYKVVWIYPMSNTGEEEEKAFDDFRKDLVNKGLYDNLDERGSGSELSEMCSDKNYLRKVIGKGDSVPYAVIHMGIYDDEKASTLNGQFYFNRNVGDTLKLIDMFKTLGMKKFILNITNTGKFPRNNPSRDSSYLAELLCYHSLRTKEYGFRVIRYNDVFGTLNYGTDKEIVLGDESTSLINVVNSVVKNKERKINLNEKIYKDRLCDDIQNNGVRNYIFGADLANLHSTLLDRDFSGDIPYSLNVGMRMNTVEILDRLVKLGHLDSYEFTPVDSSKVNPSFEYNVPDSLGFKPVAESIEEIYF